MSKYVCSVCGYVYDEANGIPESGVAPGTRWEDLPDDWTCPLCGAEKSLFEKHDGSALAAEGTIKPEAAIPLEMLQFSPLEMSAICTNLARGLEKQYKKEESILLNELADYFKSVSKSSEEPSFSQLSDLIDKDLREGYAYANAAAAEVKDRGALRALVWGEKVTKVIKSILSRYEKQGEALIEDTDVHVCTICGFIYIGDKLPDVCPVCKVPNWKFEKIEGR
ncbi:MAG: rubredoxin [Caldicoprobacterales bacterium]|jgi:rubredoxin